VKGFNTEIDTAFREIMEDLLTNVSSNNSPYLCQFYGMIVLMILNSLIRTLILVNPVIPDDFNGPNQEFLTPVCVPTGSKVLILT